MLTGEQLKTRRIEKGESQQDVARAVGVARQLVSRWELDIALPSRLRMAKLEEWSTAPTAPPTLSIPEGLMRVVVGKAGRWLKTRREEQGQSQTDAARVMGVHCTTISRWERGVMVPDSMRQIVAIAHWSGLSVDDVADALGCGLAHGDG